MVDVPYHTLIKEMPEGERPRERLAVYGEKALSNAELIAITLRTGNARENVISLAPWIAMAGGGAVTVAVLAVNLLGDFLRDVYDPRLKGLK